MAKNEVEYSLVELIQGLGPEKTKEILRKALLQIVWKETQVFARTEQVLNKVIDRVPDDIGVALHRASMDRVEAARKVFEFRVNQNTKVDLFVGKQEWTE